MNIVITGGRGQLARHLTHVLARTGHRVCALSRQQLDICDPADISQQLTAAQPQLVLNCAAYTAVDAAEKHSEQANAVNASAVGHLVDYCGVNPCRLIQFSTDYVFDGLKSGAYVETDPPAPQSVYGQSKQCAEELVFGMGADGYVLRTSWLYSERGNNFPRTMIRLMLAGQPLSVVDDQRGCPTDCQQLAEAVARLIEVMDGAGRGVNEPPQHHLYHVAGTPCVSWYQFARLIASEVEKYAGGTVNLAAVGTAQYPTPASRPANSELSSTLFEREFGMGKMCWQTRLQTVIRNLVEQERAVPG